MPPEFVVVSRHDMDPDDTVTRFFGTWDEAAKFYDSERDRGRVVTLAYVLESN